MPIQMTHKNNEFGVGDIVKVTQEIHVRNKKSSQVFEGMVIAMKNRGSGRSFTVRRIGEQGIGIERIFPEKSPQITKIEVKKRGLKGIHQAKLYYTRQQSKREIESIFSREKRKI